MTDRLLIGGTLIALSVFLLVQWYTPNEITAVSVIQDITDEQVAKPQFEEIESLFDFKNNQWDGAVFSYSTLTNVSLNQSLKITLKSQKLYTSNEFERSKDLDEFIKSIKGILDKKSEIGKRNSSVYIPIVHALQLLKETKANKKFLLIYSDLMENDPGMSLYDAKLLQEMIDEPDSVLKRFEQKGILPELNGISIYLIYRPNSIESDARFQIVSTFYKHVFGQKGAQVYIRANL